MFKNDTNQRILKSNTKLSSQVHLPTLLPEVKLIRKYSFSDAFCLHYNFFLYPIILVIMPLLYLLSGYKFTNIYLLDKTLLLLFISSCFYFLVVLYDDLKKSKENIGMVFRGDSLYLNRPLGIVKYAFIDIESVTIVPGLLNKSIPFNSNLTLPIILKTRDHALVFKSNNLAQIIDLFQEKQIEVNVSIVPRFKIIGLVVLPFLLNILFPSLPKVTGAIAVILMALSLNYSKIFSRSLTISRKKEIWTSVFIPFASVLFAFFIMTAHSQNQTAITVQKYQKSHQFEKAFKICEQLKMENSSANLNSCAWFYTTVSQASYRNYSRAILMAKNALANITNASSSKRKEIADTLACAFMGNNDVPNAMVIAERYNLADRRIEFLQNTLCE